MKAAPGLSQPVGSLCCGDATPHRACGPREARRRGDSQQGALPQSRPPARARAREASADAAPRECAQGIGILCSCARVLSSLLGLPSQRQELEGTRVQVRGAARSPPSPLQGPRGGGEAQADPQSQSGLLQQRGPARCAGEGQAQRSGLRPPTPPHRGEGFGRAWEPTARVPCEPLPQGDGIQ